MAKSRWELEENRKKKAQEKAQQAILKAAQTQRESWQAGAAARRSTNSSTSNNTSRTGTQTNTAQSGRSSGTLPGITYTPRLGSGIASPSADTRRADMLAGGAARHRTNIDSRTGTNISRGAQREARESMLAGGAARRRTNVDSRTGTNTSLYNRDMRDLQLNMTRWHQTGNAAERERLNQENNAIRARRGLSYDPSTGTTYDARTGRNYSLPTQMLYGGTAAQRARAATDIGAQLPFTREATGENEYSVSMRPTLEQVLSGTADEARGVNAHQVMNELFSRSAEEWTDQDTATRDIAVRELEEEMQRMLERYGLPSSRYGLGNAAVERLRQAGADETTLAYAQENVELREAANRLGQGLEAVAKRFIGSIPAIAETSRQQSENVAQSRQNPEYVQLEAEKQQLENQLTSMPSTNYDGSLNQDYLDVYNRLQAVQQRMQEIAVQTPVDQNKWGQTMLREAAEAQANATAGLATVPRFLANTGISIAGNAPSLLAAMIPGAGPAVGAGLMGAQATGQRAQELNAEGASPSEALGRGIVSGIIEAVTEKLPIDTLADILNRGGTDAVRSILRQMGIEAGEESASYMMNLASDWAAADPNAQFSFTDLAEQALGGAISGGVYGGAGTLIGRAGAQTAQTGTNAQQETNTPTGMQDAVQGDSRQNVSSSGFIMPEAKRRQMAAQDAEYAAQIDGVFNGSVSPANPVVIGDTPDILLSLGATDLPMTMTQSTARKIAFPAGYMGGSHNLGIPALKRLPEQMRDPAAVLRSKTQPDSFVILTEWNDTNGNPVVVAVHLDKQGHVELSNEVASAYGKNNFAALTGENGENVLYTKNNKSIDQLLSIRLQLPEAMADDTLVAYSIAQNSGEGNPAQADSQTLGQQLAELDAEMRTAESLLPGPARDARIAEIRAEMEETAELLKNGRVVETNSQREQRQNRDLKKAALTMDENAFFEYYRYVTEEWDITPEEARVMQEVFIEQNRLDRIGAMAAHAKENAIDVDAQFVPINKAFTYGMSPEQAMREAQVRAQGEAKRAAYQSEREETVAELMQAWTDKRAAEAQAERTRDGLTLTDNDIRLAQNAAMSGVDTVNWEYADNPEKAYLYGKALRAVREADQPIRQYFAQRTAALQAEAEKAADAIAAYAKEKKTGAQYQRETMERNIRDIFGKEHQAEAEAIIREYITPVHKAVAKGNQLKNSLRERVKKLKLNKHERALVQMRLEAEDGAAAEYIKNNGLTVTPEMDAKINRAVEEFRNIYDELHRRINETQVLNGQEPTPYRKNYAPHFTKGKQDLTLLARARLKLGFGADSNLKQRPDNLPTDIAGISDTFRPGKKWFGHLLQREGEITDYDIVAGFDAYIEDAADVITLTESIQKLRALEDQIRYSLSSEGVKAKIDAIRKDPELNGLQQRQEIEKAYDEQQNPTTAQRLIQNLRETYQIGMGRFVTELRRYTDNLAGKKSREDRGWEDMVNRQFYTVAKNLESRVAANMISLNPGSWLTNLIPITQASGEVSVPNLVKGMYQTVKGAVTDDGYRDASAFLTNRYGSDRLDKTLAQRASDLSGAPMELIDHFVANTIHRARYAQNIDKGMSMDAAIEDADAYTASLMADRSKGALPTAFNATNPIRKVFTMFQTEVNNQLSYLFKDMPKAQREKGVAAVAWAYTKVFGTAYLFNLAYSALTGRDAALDPVGIIADALGIGDDEDEERSGWDVAADLGLGVAENLPFVGGILGGGRVPIQSAFPNPITIWNSLSGDAAPEKKAQTVGKELAKPLTYLLPKFGGGAARRAIEGYATIDAGGSYTYDSDGNRVLQFPAYGQKPQDYARAMLFGKWSSEEAQEYIDKGFKGLSADETAVFDQLRNNMGLDARQAMDTILSLRGFESVKDSEGNTVQTVKDQQRLALFDNENLTPEQKAAVDRALIVSGEDEQPADYSDRNAFLLGQYVSESRRDAAREAISHGLSIDQFVTWDDRLSELTGEKDENDKKVRTEAEARGIVLDEVMQDSTLSDSEKQAIADYVLISSIGEEDEKTRENWETIAKGKVNASDFVRFQADTSVYDDWAEGTGTDNAANVATILRGYDSLTDEQRDVLFQTYRDNMSVNPFHVSVYEKSIDPNGSFYGALTDDGKARLRSLLNEYEQDINEGAELDEWRAKAYMAEKEAGISPATYAMYRVALETANTDDKGNPRQSEAEACVNAMDGLTQYQKAYLYASTNSSWKNNPFGSAAVGEYSSGQEVGINPVAGATVTSRFGPRKSFQTDNGAMSSSLHPSIDIGAAEGTPIGAYKSGKVTQNGWVNGYGWTIEVTHSDGTVSAYHHMMEQSPVAVGTEVKQGEQIGKVGQTGNSKGAHLDLTITRDGKPIDPATLIPELQDSATGYVWTGSNVYTNVTSGSGQDSGGSSGSSSGLKRLDDLSGFKSLF